jgi:signal peptidase I
MLNKIGEWALEGIQVIGISAIIIAILHIFIIQPNEVNGESMTPYLQDKDRIITEKLSYRFNEPKRGEIVVFKYPLDPTEEYIKRIVALPNESIEIIDNQVVIYNQENPNGFVLQEDYLKKGAVTTGRAFIKEGEKITVPDNNYIVFGDHREGSSDSRLWGYVKKDEIVGRAYVRIWPAQSISLIIPK